MSDLSPEQLSILARISAIVLLAYVVSLALSVRKRE